VTDVQGRSRPVDFSINRKPVSDFLLANDTNHIALSRTISKLWLIIAQIFASGRGYLTLTLSLGKGVIPCECPVRVVVLPDTEDRMTVWLIWTKQRNVTDGRTDLQTDLLWLIQRSALRAITAAL